MNNATLFLIETLAPYIDKLKVGNPLLYTVMVVSVYSGWFYSNHLLLSGFDGTQMQIDGLKFVNYFMPIVLGAIQSRTTSHIKRKK